MAVLGTPMHTKTTKGTAQLISRERETESPHSQLSRRLGGHPCQSEHFGTENNLSCLPGID